MEETVADRVTACELALMQSYRAGGRDACLQAPIPLAPDAHIDCSRSGLTDRGRFEFASGQAPDACNGKLSIYVRGQFGTQKSADARSKAFRKWAHCKAFDATPPHEDERPFKATWELSSDVSHEPTYRVSLYVADLRSSG